MRGSRIIKLKVWDQITRLAYEGHPANGGIVKTKYLLREKVWWPDKKIVVRLSSPIPVGRTIWSYIYGSSDTFYYNYTHYGRWWCLTDRITSLKFQSAVFWKIHVLSRPSGKVIYCISKCKTQEYLSIWFVLPVFCSNFS